MSGDLLAERLREQIERRYECRAKLEYVVAVQSPSDRYVVLSVHVFQLLNHPRAQRAYSWEEEGVFYAMQHNWFVRSPKGAVSEAYNQSGGY